MVLNQGDTFSTTLNLTDDNGNPLNLSGFTASATMKKWYASNVVFAFNTSINNSLGTITLEMDANVTANIFSGRFVYDVDITDGTSSTRIVEGMVTVSPGVTNSNTG